MSALNSYLPAKDAELDDWLVNFNTVAANNLAVLNLKQTDLTPSVNATQTFTTDLAGVATAHAAAKNATMNKDVARKNAVVIARTLVKKIQATPNVPDTLKAQLGITIGTASHKPVPLFAPATAAAAIQAGGIVQLTWSSNGNAPGAIYTIEMSLGTPDNWNVVNSQTATRYLDTEAPLGTVMYYRVKAQRNTRVSAYSNNAMVTPK